MKYTFNDIDRLLDEQLSSFQPGPPEGAWEQIQQQLPPAKPVQSPGVSNSLGTKLFASKWIIAGLSGVVSIAAAYVMLHTNSASNRSTPVNQSIEKPIQTEPVQISTPIPEKNSDNQPQSTSPQADVKSDNQLTPLNPEVVHTETNTNFDPINAGDHSAVSIENSIQPAPKPVKKQLIEPVISNEKSDKTSGDVPSGKMTREEDNLFIPNIFTPNSQDDLNSVFEIKIENENVYRLKIFNSKGQVVFTSDDKRMRWNGNQMNMGEPCDEGVYTYEFVYQFNGEETTHMLNGRIQLKR